MREDRTPRLLLLGSNGQVGWELKRTLAPLGDVCAHDRASLDISDHRAIRDAVQASAADVIVNAAAYTQVDRAEGDSAAAMRVNAEAPEVIGSEAHKLGALLVHFSTDYVFDGVATRPYTEDDIPNPATVYGVSKRRGDEAVLASHADAYIFRIAWVYAMRGRNFLQTVLRLARERDELRIVADQWGTPTWSRPVAEAVSSAVAVWLSARRGERNAPLRGVYHLASPDYTTWHGFASAIVEKAPVDPGARPIVIPISSSDYPTPATRPRWSVMDSTRARDAFGVALPAWRDQLASCISNSS